MLSLFLALTAFNLLLLLLTALLGYAYGGSETTQWHALAGIVATMTCCGVHCIVFTYFIATAKWVQHAVTVKHLEPSLAAPTRSFKLQAFPAALLAMLIVFIAAVFGAAHVSYEISPTYHHVLAWIAIAINAIVAVTEYRAIARNGRLIDEILARINTPTAAAR
ncbi:MAG TPA: hypothetical protein VGR35_11200 [Tepidisphaeraceae bacterium]|nr:hypothetical protein [Tepidisphaeraceae bacterium]